ncbi:DNA alkylation repair protein [uncultured Bacteroides sp.]|uniref:DNA alkylation repair protein n=1 Tax=uncultured Bacteroides sp. TaxID=162156 RepID=UPI0025E20E21|nr:DNA alkylation repair protein [uncultured Bacteroides sp.]
MSKLSKPEHIRKELQTLADTKYKEFHSALVPGSENILGVRIPQLRTLAKEIAQRDDWRTLVEATDTRYYEETMLQGMIIGRAHMETDERIKYIRMFVPRIDNWAVCDIFCGELKIAVRKNTEIMWQLIQPYLTSSKEFEIRFGIVMLFHYVDKDHIDTLLTYADTFCHEAYYARMAMAWLLSGCYVKFPEKTMEYLKQSKLDNWTYNKALQKTIESLRIDKETKDLLRTMKRR